MIATRTLEQNNFQLLSVNRVIAGPVANLKQEKI